MVVTRVGDISTKPIGLGNPVQPASNANSANNVLPASGLRGFKFDPEKHEVQILKPEGEGKFAIGTGGIALVNGKPMIVSAAHIGSDRFKENPDGTSAGVDQSPEAPTDRVLVRIVDKESKKVVWGGEQGVPTNRAMAAGETDAALIALPGGLNIDENNSKLPKLDTRKAPETLGSTASTQQALNDRPNTTFIDGGKNDTGDRRLTPVSGETEGEFVRFNSERPVKKGDSGANIITQDPQGELKLRGVVAQGIVPQGGGDGSGSRQINVTNFDDPTVLQNIDKAFSAIA